MVRNSKFSKKLITTLVALVLFSTNVLMASSYSFRVQCAQQGDSNLVDILDKIPNKKTFYTQTAFTIYFSGGYTEDYFEAMETLDECHERGIPNAFIRVFKNDAFVANEVSTSLLGQILSGKLLPQIMIDYYASIENKKKDDARKAAEKIAAEKKKIEEEKARLAEQARLEEERLHPEKAILRKKEEEAAKRAEGARLAEEARLLAEAKKVEAERLLAEAAKKKAADAEAARLAAEARLLAEQKRIEGERLAAEAAKKKAENEKNIAEAKRIEQERLLAEKARLKDEKNADKLAVKAKKSADKAKKKEVKLAVKLAKEAKEIAELKKVEDDRIAAEQAVIDEEKRVKDTRIADELAVVKEQQEKTAQIAEQKKAVAEAIRVEEAKTAAVIAKNVEIQEKKRIAEVKAEKEETEYEKLTFHVVESPAFKILISKYPTKEKKSPDFSRLKKAIYKTEIGYNTLLFTGNYKTMSAAEKGLVELKKDVRNISFEIMGMYRGNPVSLAMAADLAEQFVRQNERETGTKERVGD
ncbi:MAG: hypothetical protein ACJA0Q_000829 [Saprospiraceae bacterium]|jgi:hypothetical protein